MEENIIQDSIEKRIRTKCINVSCHMIEILLRKKYVNFIDDVNIIIVIVRTYIFQNIFIIYFVFKFLLCIFFLCM